MHGVLSRSETGPLRDIAPRASELVQSHETMRNVLRALVSCRHVDRGKVHSVKDPNGPGTVPCPCYTVACKIARDIAL